MKNLFIFIFLSGIFYSCPNYSQMNDQNILTYLKEKYNKDFTIISSDYIPNIRKYNITVSPSDDLDLQFVTEFFEENNNLLDNYTESYLNHDAIKYMASKLTEFDVPYVYSVSSSYGGSIDNLKEIPAWNDLVESNPAEIVYVLKMNIFSEPTDELLNQLVELDQFLRFLSFSKVGFSYYFFKPEALEGNSIKNLDCSFSTNNRHFEYLNKDKFISKILYYAKEKDTKPSIEDLKKVAKESFLYIQYAVI